MAKPLTERGGTLNERNHRPDGAFAQQSNGQTASAGEVAVRGGIVALLPDLRAFARFLCRDRVRADDLVQETVVRSIAARDQFDPATSLRAWTFTILRNLFYEQSRRRKREREVLDEYGADHVGVAAASADFSQIWDLDRMLWSLPPLMREALTLVGAHGMSYEEAAAVCGVAVGTIKARVSRARSALDQQMQNDQPPAKGGG
ncbi:sigma-70 family RNA polymerase sigma factor [Acetobacter sacchari]|uniref:Sigma-70 family RNA polymerase sigma factor n=1 Tax=Acetobacter sacchari TaxID=2661687 RepID=A0ABS3LYL6_9PROT|nr:sigma-70 family RNA polymerase sigma factor [Acetobacter sacchari]